MTRIELADATLLDDLIVFLQRLREELLHADHSLKHQISVLADEISGARLRLIAAYDDIDGVCRDGQCPMESIEDQWVELDQALNVLSAAQDDVCENYFYWQQQLQIQLDQVLPAIVQMIHRKIAIVLMLNENHLRDTVNASNVNYSNSIADAQIKAVDNRRTIFPPPSVERMPLPKGFSWLPVNAIDIDDMYRARVSSGAIARSGYMSNLQHLQAALQEIAELRDARIHVGALDQIPQTAHQRPLLEALHSWFGQNPVAVFPMRNGRFGLVDGAHRLLAASALHWEKLPVRVLQPVIGR